MKLIDIDSDFLIQRHRNGIKLTKPLNSFSNSINLQTLFNHSFNLYLVDCNSASQRMNECTLISCGFNSNSDIFGKSVVDVWGNTDAMKKIIIHDKKVITSGEIQIEEEDVICKDKISHNSLSIKLPWYNSKNEIIGLLGCTLVIGMPTHISLSTFISVMVKNNLLNSSTLPGIQINDFYFSKREKEIIFLIIRGKTAKQIARIFGTSYRTVEHQIANIKYKLNVKTKSDLIEKVFELLQMH